MSKSFDSSPSSSTESRIVSNVSWGGSVFGILSGLALLLPGASQTFMMENPMVGWIAFALMLLLYGPTAAWYRRNAEAAQARIWGQKVVDLSRNWSKEGRTLAKQWSDKEETLRAEFRAKESELMVTLAVKDDLLLRDRLEGMEMHSDFHAYLTKGDGHENLNRAFADKLDTLTDRWHADAREFSDAEVSEAWTKLRQAGEAYAQGLDSHLFQNPEHPQRLHLGPELKLRDRTAYYAALEKLDRLRSDFCVSLNELQSLEHARGINLP